MVWFRCVFHPEMLYFCWKGYFYRVIQGSPRYATFRCSFHTRKKWLVISNWWIATQKLVCLLPPNHIKSPLRSTCLLWCVWHVQHVHSPGCSTTRSMNLGGYCTPKRWSSETSTVPFFPIPLRYLNTLNVALRSQQKYSFYMVFIAGNVVCWWIFRQTTFWLPTGCSYIPWHPPFSLSGWWFGTFFSIYWE